MNTTARGAAGVNIVAAKLRSLGYYITQTHPHCAFDLVVNNWRVEVKHPTLVPAYRREGRGRWGASCSGSDDRFVDFYVICLSDVPNVAEPQLLILPTPLGKRNVYVAQKTLHIQPNLNAWEAFFGPSLKMRNRAHRSQFGRGTRTNGFPIGITED